MSTRGKRKRPVKAAAPEAWPPSAVAEAERLNAEAWRREPSIDDPDARAELERHRVAAIGTLMSQLRKHRSGRPRGALKRSTIYVHALARHPEHAKQSWKMLWALADKKRLGRMSENTFRDHVTNARRRK